LAVNLTTVYNFDQTGLHMEEVSISEFKARCPALLEQVNKTKKPLRVTRHGKPIAEVVPPTTVADRAALMVR